MPTSTPPASIRGFDRLTAARIRILLPQLYMASDSSANTSPENRFAEYENGELSNDEIIQFFQNLIDTGQCWKLQSTYGRLAMLMIASGKCLLGPVGYRDCYGSWIPSRDEVPAGLPGSREYVLKFRVS